MICYFENNTGIVEDQPVALLASRIEAVVEYDSYRLIHIKDGKTYSVTNSFEECVDRWLQNLPKEGSNL